MLPDNERRQLASDAILKLIETFGFDENDANDD
jgi:hypothetical protein